MQPRLPTDQKPIQFFYCSKQSNFCPLQPSLFPVLHQRTERAAAIYRHIAAGNESGFIVCQIGYGAGYIIAGSGMPYPGAGGLLDFIADQSRRDAVDCNIFIAHFHSHNLGHHLHPGFTTGVCYITGQAHHSGNAADVDYAPVIILQHRFDKYL